MKIVESQVTKLLITEIPLFDPITVILEDFGEGRGKLIIEEYGASYAAFWGAMGGSLVNFVTQCSADYIVDKISNIPHQVFDGEGLCQRVRKDILRERRQKEITADDARTLWDEASDLESIEDPYVHAELLFKHLGDDWHSNMPYTVNPHYRRLVTLVTHVQKALAQWQHPS